MIDIDKVHTTELGNIRIKKNLNIDCDVVDYCKKILLNNKCNVFKKGKNYYCELDNILLTINSYNYCIITAHKKGK